MGDDPGALVGVEVGLGLGVGVLVGVGEGEGVIVLVGDGVRVLVGDGVLVSVGERVIVPVSAGRALDCLLAWCALAFKDVAFTRVNDMSISKRQSAAAMIRAIERTLWSPTLFVLLFMCSRFPLRCVFLHKYSCFSCEDEILPLELSVELMLLSVKKGGQWYHIDRWVDGGMREGGKAGKKLLTGGVGYSNIGRVRGQA